MDQVASVAGVPVSTGPRVPTPETPERGHTASCHTVANHRRTHRNRGTLIHTRPLFRAGILNGSPDLLFEILWSTLMIISVALMLHMQAWGFPKATLHKLLLLWIQIYESRLLLVLD